MTVFKWLTNWFMSNCNGDWEHENQIKIYTVDNPGWSIQIDLTGSSLESVETDYFRVENGSSDWYGFKFHDGKYSAAGDLSKLEFLLEIFKKNVEDIDKSTPQHHF